MAWRFGPVYVVAFAGAAAAGGVAASDAVPPRSVLNDVSENPAVTTEVDKHRAFEAAFLGEWWDESRELLANSTDNGSSDLSTPPTYDWPELVNWDCASTKKVADWDALYEQVIAGFSGDRQNNAGLGFDRGVFDRASNGSDDAYVVLPDAAIAFLSGHVAEARSACPLGYLYFLTVQVTMFLLGSGDTDPATHAAQAEELQRELRRYPFFVIASGRWPVFEVLNYFTALNSIHSARAVQLVRCEGMVGGRSGINWDEVRTAAITWSDEQLQGLDPGEGDSGSTHVLKTALSNIFQGNTTLFAQQECPFGVIFAVAIQALKSAFSDSGVFELWCRMLDAMLSGIPWHVISSCGWPVYRTLAYFASSAKGSHIFLPGFQDDVQRWGRWHPSSKRFRRYADLGLSLSDLLGPWASGSLHALGVGSSLTDKTNRSGAYRYVDKLVALNAKDWMTSLLEQSLPHEQDSLVDAAVVVMNVLQGYRLPFRWECGHSGTTRDACLLMDCIWHENGGSSGTVQQDEQQNSPACQRKRPKRKVLGVTFVWGEHWARLIPRFVGWAHKLTFSTVVVAMGTACYSACNSAVAALGGPLSSGVGCWDPFRHATSQDGAERGGSIMQRHAMVLFLLHQGIDVIAFDFDTFWFDDPRRRLELLAEESRADVLMVRHLDADCVNMGLLYIRASGRTAEWYRRYLGWFHQHPYEREQRGANALLGFTNQKISFKPRNMPYVNAALLDDNNAFVSSRGGWLGNWSQLLFFHWVNPAQTPTSWSDTKIDDLDTMYDVALHPSLRRSSYGGRSFARVLEGSGSPPIEKARQILEDMIVWPAPKRTKCW
eukprot:TRINITY_DN10100_c0_g1_i3.p1 TRINITY_DN10100_c0_g1~~TRINITY_DN10100_c0_g1_i3.p1  ORF type:complete len:844 (-),score=94.56 TRINITY_DN10100_c0_g1_i3:27-2513(-)